MRAEGAASTPGLHCGDQLVVLRREKEGSSNGRGWGKRIGGAEWSGGGNGAWRSITCPPEKPTATTPSSSALERNFGLIIEVVVMVSDSVVLGRDPV